MPRVVDQLQLRAPSLLGDHDARRDVRRPLVAEHDRPEAREPLPGEDDRPIVSEPRDVDAEPLLRPIVLVAPEMPLHRRLDLLDAEQRVDARGRELAEHIHHDPRVLATVGVDLLLRELERDARAPLRILRVARDRHDIPEMPLRRASHVERAARVRRVAGLNDLRLDAAREHRLRRHHDRLRDAARLVEHEQAVVAVDARQGVTLLVRAARLRPRARDREPRRRELRVPMLDSRLRPLERRPEEIAPPLPERQLRPQVRREVVRRDRGRRDLRLPPRRQEVEHQPREDRRLARPLARLHREPVVVRERLKDLELPRIGLDAELLPDERLRVPSPPIERLACVALEVHRPIPSLRPLASSLRSCAGSSFQPPCPSRHTAPPPSSSAQSLR